MDLKKERHQSVMVDHWSEVPSGDMSFGDEPSLPFGAAPSSARHGPYGGIAPSHPAKAMNIEKKEKKGKKGKEKRKNDGKGRDAGGNKLLSGDSAAGKGKNGLQFSAEVCLSSSVPASLPPILVTSRDDDERGDEHEFGRRNE